MSVNFKRQVHMVNADLARIDIVLHADVISLLLKKGADVNAKNSMGWTGGTVLTAFVGQANAEAVLRKL